MRSSLLFEEYGLYFLYRQLRMETWLFSCCPIALLTCKKTCPVLPQGKGENSPFCPVFGLLWSKWNSVLYRVKVTEWQRVAIFFEQV